MAATLPNAVYQGPFFQITRQIEGDVLTPLWAGWNDGWDDWPYWAMPIRATMTRCNSLPNIRARLWLI